MNNESGQAVNNILIVGGGSAGWLLAGILASEYREQLRITLIESPDVKIVGVGEGTWPTMRSTLQRIGIAEADFLVKCSASFKQGTRFVDWRDGTDGEYYYHPFSVPAGYTDLNLVPYWQEHRDSVSFANAVSPQGRICDRDLAPKQQETPDYAFVVNYGYHLDAGKFAQMLQEHCTGKLGVRHVLDHVTKVNGDPDADIKSVSTAGSGDIEADLFIDCTGFAALLLGKHYQVPFIDKREVLFNDTALAAQVPYASDNSPIASQTISTAQGAGWVWDIGLTSRRGIGYTYSSAHTTDEEAHAALRKYIGNSSTIDVDELEPRKIQFRPGHRREFWHRNCLAVGMAAGFLEPLEASALVLIELAGNMLAEQLPANRDVMDIVAKRYNDRFLYRWERVIDFLKLHYVLSERTDSDYWMDNRSAETVPESLQELLTLWRSQAPGHRDLERIDEVFSTASYQYVLYGMGFETHARNGTSRERNAERAEKLFADNSSLAAKLVANLPDNRKLLKTIAQSAGQLS